MSGKKSDLRRRLPAGCVEDTDRHGNVRVYFRRKGARKVRLRGVPWTPEFMAAYAEALAGTPKIATNVISAGTWRWLCVKYFAECADYRRLDPRTRHVRRLVLEATFDEPIAPGSPKEFRDIPLSKMTANAVEVLRDRKLAYPEAANARVKAIRQVFKFAVRKKHAALNPARDVPYIRTGSTGYHTWTVEEVRQFEERHPVGSKARLALALLAFTGQRRSDVVRLGKQHRKAQKLSFTQHKNRNRTPKKLILPLLPALQAVIEKSPCGDLTFLVTQFGKPFTEAGFGNKFREWCDEAGLPHCTAHGLRKAGATIAANNGATSRQLMAIFGWDSIRMAEEYTRRADQERLADDAMHLIQPRDVKA
ncbi:tyrosine-type recombinase/integrase [Bradyrhizobium ottawaense]|uniref:tyrosine-type recombinase/integrase n=1 Tax=Bradyrhizobium ottawaense TaxID=931866 RepID=UPI003514416C